MIPCLAPQVTRSSYSLTICPGDSHHVSGNDILHGLQDDDHYFPGFGCDAIEEPSTDGGTDTIHMPTGGVPINTILTRIDDHLVIVYGRVGNNITIWYQFV